MTPMPDKVIKSRHRPARHRHQQLSPRLQIGPDTVAKADRVIDVLDDLGAHHNVSLVFQARDLSWRRKQIDLMKCSRRNLGVRDTYSDLTEFEANASAHDS